jgi:hypothetical protein
MIALMIQAGAKPDPQWLETASAPKLNADRRMRKLLGFDVPLDESLGRTQ